MRNRSVNRILAFVATKYHHSDVNKDLTFKAKDQTFKAKDQDKD